MGSFKEAESGILKLPDDDPRALEVFITYLLVGSVAPIQELEQQRHVTFQRMKEIGMIECEIPWHKLLQMASKYLLDDLQRQTIDCIRAYHFTTKTVCHPELLIEDFESWTHLGGDGVDDALEVYAMDELHYIKRANPDQYAFFIDHMLERRPDVVGAFLKRRQGIFLEEARFSRFERRNGFGNESTKEHRG